MSGSASKNLGKCDREAMRRDINKEHVNEQVVAVGSWGSVLPGVSGTETETQHTPPRSAT